MKTRAHILIFIGILALGGFVAVVNTTAQQQVKRDVKKAKQFREQAAKAYSQKNYRNAIDLYTKAIEFDTSNAEGYFWRGYAHQYVKEFEASLADVTKSLELGYKALDVYRIRSYVNYERKDYPAALTDINELLKAEPNDVRTIKLSAELNYELKNYDEALASYEKLATLAPPDGNTFYLMARIYAGKGDVQKQISAATTAAQRGTSFLADAHILAAEGQTKLGMMKEAEASYLSALASRQDMPAVYRALGEMYRSQSRFNDAIEITRRALRIWTTDGSFYTDNSWYYSLAGRHEDAIGAAQAGIRYLPDQPMAYTNLCRAYNDVEKFELAISACNGALKLKADDGETLFYLARANDGLNRTAEATRLYKRAVTGLVAFTRDNPTYSDAFYLLGNAYYADNQSANAIAAYKKALDLSPRFARARYNLGMVYLDGKDKSSASEQHRLLSGIDQALAGKLKTEIDKLP